MAKVLAYAGNVRRFANAKELTAFIGVTPRQRISASSLKGRTMMSRFGHAQLRRALYMPALWQGDTIRYSRHLVIGLALRCLRQRRSLVQ